MKFIPLAQRVDAAFPNQSDEAFGAQYLSSIVDSWREVAKSLRTCLTLIVVLMVAFVALRHARDAQLTVAGLSFKDVSDVLLVIPVVVSVLGYEAICLVWAFATYRETVRHLVRVLHPSVFENNLELMLVPPTINLMGGVGSNWQDIRASRPGIGARVLDATAIAIFVLVTAGSLAFLYYAYFDLYKDSHASSVAVTVSLVAALLFVTRFLAVLAHSNDD